VTASRGSGTVISRLFAVLVGLILIVAPTVLPHAAAGEPGSVPFLQVRIDRVTPEVVTTTSEPVVTVTGTVENIGDRPVHDVMVQDTWICQTKYFCLWHPQAPCLYLPIE
jgi:hypothetical protein